MPPFTAMSSPLQQVLLLNNPICFHQHRERLKITPCFFNNIAREARTDIFPPFVFNNIARLSFIFSPRDFWRLCSNNRLTALFTIAYVFVEFWPFAANLLIFLTHRERTRDLRVTGPSDHRLIYNPGQRSVEWMVARDVDEGSSVPRDP
jgi:hypothetical protein